MTNMMGKAPADQFYWNDWLSDVELQQASACSKGVWINALCRMWYSKPRGELASTKEGLVKLCICSLEEFEIFFNEAKALGFCYVLQNSNGLITLRNRRMYNKEKAKESNRLRQQRFYKKQTPNGDSNNDLTPPSSSSSSSSPSKKEQLDYSQLQNKTDKLCKSLSGYFKDFNFYAWRQEQVNKQKHPQGIEECLRLLWDNRKTAKKVRPYLTQLMKIKGPNAFEREAVVEHEKRKKEELSYDGHISGIFKKVD